MGQSKTRTKGIYTEADGSKTISKIWKGERIYKRLGNVSQEEAETWLHNRIENKQQIIERSKNARYVFAECAARYLTECEGKASIETIAIHIRTVIPFIGNIEIEKIHDGTLKPLIDKRKKDGVSPTTINRALEVVSTVLNQSARVYRDDDGQPWLKQAPPKITMLKENQRKPRPISYSEQKRLISELPNHLVNLVLFAVNTGLRNENVCGLKWEWEQFIPEIERSVFIIPPDFHKTGKKSNRAHVVVLNDLAWDIIGQQRNKDTIHVFPFSHKRTYKGENRIETINNNGWKAARKRAGLELVRVHDLRHTYGMRLRSVGVNEEDRAALLGHACRSMPSHYAAADIKRLLDLSNKVLNEKEFVTIVNIANF